MSFALDGNTPPTRDPTPAYWRIFQTLRQRIAVGTYAVDSQLPTEDGLMRSFGVSRHTIRAAVQQLEAQGLVRRQAGKGTFVLNSATQGGRWAAQSLEDLLDRSFSDRIVNPNMQLIRRGDSEEAAARLWLETRERVARFTWMRSSEQGPCSFATVYLAQSRAKALPKNWSERLATTRLLHLIEACCSLEAFRVRQSSSAVAANDEIAQRLHVALNAPLLSLERTYFDRSSEAIEHSIILARPDRCEQKVELYRVSR